MKALDYFSVGHPLSKVRSKLSLVARKNIFQIFANEMPPQVGEKVLDVGVTPDIHLPDSNFFERFYPYAEQITAVSIEDASNIEETFPGVKFVLVEPGPLPFGDNQFDVLFCSAVLEHVGCRQSQAQFLEELARVSKKFFITTPNRWHPVEFHTILPFIHWLPQKIHQRVLKLLGYSFLSKTENLNLCGRKDVEKMMPETCSYKISYKWFLGFPSNLIVVGSSTA